VDAVAARRDGPALGLKTPYDLGFVLRQGLRVDRVQAGRERDPRISEELRPSGPHVVTLAVWTRPRVTR
jgi:hypothetical protein